MHKAVAIRTPLLVTLMACGLVLLVMIAGSLYLQNKSYRIENRELIIRNDSVISVNIELRSALNGKPDKSVKRASYEAKKENTQ